MSDQLVTSLQPENIVPRLVAQPAEIIIAIFRWLTAKDLLSLRSSCKSFHNLVHHHERGICDAYCGQLKREHMLLSVQSQSQSSDICSDLLRYVQLQQQYSEIWELAGILSTHMISKLNLQTRPADKAALRHLRATKAGELRRCLFPFLFGLETFLRSLRQIVAEAEQAFATWDDHTFTSASDVFIFDQQRLVEEICKDAATLSGISAAHSILAGTLSAKGLKSNLRSMEWPFCSVKRVLLLRGLSPFASLLAEDKGHGARLTALAKASQSVLRHYEVKQHIHPLRSIHHLDTARLTLPAPERHRPFRVLNKFIDSQSIWARAAHAVAQRNYGLEVLQDESGRGTDTWILAAISKGGGGVYSLADWRAP